MATTSGPIMEFLGRLAYELHHMKPLVPTYIHLLLSALFPIYTAAHAALARPNSAAPAKRKKTTDVNEYQDEEISPTIEALTASDAIMFPILAGATLTTLYFLLKYLQDPDVLNYYLGLYFAVMGLFFNIKFIKDGLAVVRSFVLPNQYSHNGRLWKVCSDESQFTAIDNDETKQIRTSPLPGMFSIFFRSYNSGIWALRKLLYTRYEVKFSIIKLIRATTYIDTLDLMGAVLAAPLVYYHTFVDKPWFLTNILGFSFCYGALQITTPGTSSTGSLLLCALFFYDIYFVFFTPMMVTVATKLDVPIKLLFPRPDGCVLPVGAKEGSEAMEKYLQCIAKRRTMAMLGLGDIVIPGMMLAFALRFDLYLHYQNLATATRSTSNDGKEQPKKVSYLPVTGMWGERTWTSKKFQSSELQAKHFAKTYFKASVVGYVLGMVATVVVMQISQHAQPALLYLVPGVLTALWGTALVQGDFKTLWKYSEIPEEQKTNEKDKKSKNGSENDKRKHEQEVQIDAIQNVNGTVDSNNSTEKDPDGDRGKIEDQHQDTGADISNLSKKNEHSIIQQKKPDEATTASSTSANKNKRDNSEDKHLIFFSVCVVEKVKQKPVTEQTAKQSQAQPVEEQDLVAPSTPPQQITDDAGRDDSDKFSTDTSDDSEQDKTLPVKQPEPATKTRMTLRSATRSPEIRADGGKGDNEPAVKRRRKA